MAKIEIINLIKRYDDLEVLHDLSFEIADKEFVVLVGPSGCGKTTLLRMIAGLEEVTQGKIILGDRVINYVPEKDRDIAMVFQSYALYPHMTVRGNMSFSLRMRKMDKAEQTRRIEWAAEMLELSEYLDRYPRQLSGGQRQRVAMGRALVREPMAFLLDEPLSNLDAQLRVQMRTELRGLHQRLQATMVYVTHDQIEAMTLADRIVVMNNGNIEQIGTPDEVYDNPANTFVASFIGSPAMNMLKGKLQRNNGKIWIDLSGGGRVELPSNQSGEDGMPVILGVRPEDFLLTNEKDGLELSIDMIEMTGRELEMFGQREGAQICVLLRDRQKVKAGETVWIRPNVEHSQIFQADTGMALPKI